MLCRYLPIPCVRVCYNLASGFACRMLTSHVGQLSNGDESIRRFCVNCGIVGAEVRHRTTTAALEDRLEARPRTRQTPIGVCRR